MILRGSVHYRRAMRGFEYYRRYGWVRIVEIAEEAWLASLNEEVVE